MSIVNCPYCGAGLVNDGALVGQVVACPHCKGHMQMPPAAAPPMPPPVVVAIRFTCPNCGKVFTTADDTVGKRAKCGKCGTSFVIPAGAPRVGTIPAPVGAPKDDFDGGVTMRPRQPPRAQPVASGRDEFDIGATLAPRRPAVPPLQEDFDRGATIPRAKPDTSGNHAQADTHQDRTTSVPAPDLALGSEVDGRYVVVSKLGQGGMGAVYKVVDKDTQTEFALKVLAADLVGSSEALADLKKEVAIALQLTHQNLLRVNYLGCTPQLTYLLMEYIDGEDLETYRIRHGGRIAADDLRRLMPQLLHGLDYLHNKGIVHLDIKPRNIMVSKTGELKLTDFGVSRSIKEQVSRRNQDQDFAGTLCFMAPEQIRKQVCDRRADIYATGIVFYQLLTGQLPFATGDPKAIMAWHLGPDPDFSRFPADWRTLFQMCLVREPSRRFAACKEMLPFFSTDSGTAFDDIFGNSASPNEQQFRRAVVQAFSTGDPKPQQRESLRSLMQQLSISADLAKRIVGEHKAERVAAASQDKRTENLRILLEAEQFEEAAAVAKKILGQDAKNGLAWAAKSWGTRDVEETLKCFEMADKFAPNDAVVEKLKFSKASWYLKTAQDQLNRFAAAEYNSNRFDVFGLALAALGAMRLAPALKDEAMGLVVHGATGAIETSGCYFSSSFLREFFGNAIFDEYFIDSPDVLGLAEPRRPTSEVERDDPSDPLTFLSGGATQRVKPLSRARVVAHVCWQGQWMLLDANVKVTFDGQSTTGSFCNGFQFPFKTSPGVHTLSVKLPIRGAQTYQLNLTQPGEYRIDLEYSETWGNFTKQCFISEL